MIVSGIVMLSLRRPLQCLAAAGTAFALLTPITAAATGSGPSADSLWNQADGLSMDSALYVVQDWLNGFNRQVSDNPTRRGLDELAQANSDLLAAYTLLQHRNDGPQPVPVVDPLFAGVYDAITGSTAKAPLGSLFSGINHGLLSLEGRGTTDETARRLLEDYRIRQAVGTRDLHRSGSAANDQLIAANAQRQADFLARLRTVAMPADGLATLLDDASRETASLAHSSLTAAVTTPAAGRPSGSRSPVPAAQAPRPTPTAGASREDHGSQQGNRDDQDKKKKK